MSQRAVEPIFATTTPIRYKSVEGGGTGFFLNHNGETYLVTNRHVVDPEDESPDQARIWFRNYRDIANTNHFDISLSGGDSKDWFGHPESADIDLAVIPLDTRLSSVDDVGSQNHMTGSLAFTRQHYIHENISVDNRVVILGYPGDFVDKTTLFPVRRNALISSPYGTRFNGSPFFVTDARMHPGTSGSPVLMQAGGMMMTSGDVPEERSKGVYLLGVHSATFYRSERGESENEDQLWSETHDDSENGDEQPTKYELNVAWYPELIDDVLQQID